MTTQAPIHFFGIASNGKVRFAEQLVTRDDAGKLVWSWTGTSYRTLREAQDAIASKNLAISKERYGG